MKYFNATYKIDKKYVQEIREKKQRFIEYTKTKKQVFNTFITNYGLLENEYSIEISDSEITLDSLFR